MKLTKEDFESSLTEPPRSLTDEEIKQILDNQEKAERWDYLNSAFREPVDWTKIEYFAVSEVNKDNPQVAHLDTEWQKLQQELKKLKDSIEFQLDKHTGKVGYEYITKILKEILN